MAYKTAFFVAVDEDNNISITTDPKTLGLEDITEATLKDVRRVVLEISADLAAQAAAQYFISTITPPQAEETAEETEEVAKGE